MIIFADRPEPIRGRFHTIGQGCLEPRGSSAWAKGARAAMTEPRTRTNRRDTERRLIDAALDLIRSNGVLAGLNLREVAEAAGVNRGNI